PGLSSARSAPPARGQAREACHTVRARNETGSCQLQRARSDRFLGQWVVDCARSFSIVVAALAVLVCGPDAGAQPDATEEILKQAIGLHQAGNITGAIQAYQKYLAQRPDSLIALSNLGAAYARIARYQDAIVQYRHALTLQPGNTPVELNLALAFYKTGQTEAAAS